MASEPNAPLQSQIEKSLPSRNEITAANDQLSGNAGGYRIQPSFWARRKIDDLMSQDWVGLQNGSMKPALQKEITQLGLDYGLMTQFTSFVAVEERTVTKDGKPVRVEVPVEMPEGVSYEGVVDERDALYQPRAGLTLYSQLGMVQMSTSRASRGVVQHKIPSPPPPSRGASNPGPGAGAAGGVGGGMYNGQLQTPTTIPPAPAMTFNGGPKETALAEPTGERARLEAKLHPALLKAFDCWKKSGTDCKLANGGAVEVQVWLTDNSSAVLEQLKNLGFVTSQTRPKEKVVIGHLPAEKLAELAKIGAVKFVSPVRR
jgi:hypothetical protein